MYKVPMIVKEIAPHGNVIDKAQIKVPIKNHTVSLMNRFQ